MDDFNMDGESRLPSASTSAPFKLDEGFSEDSQFHGDQIQNSFLSWLNSQSERAKAEIAYEILRTLRSTDIAAVVERLNPLLHMDPIEKLPPEITAQIFSYLDATTLLTASLSSATWRERILDPRLWQELYRSQGWGIDLREVRAFEAAHADLVRSEFKKARAELRNSLGHQGPPLFKRRATSDWLQSAPRRVSASAEVAEWREQHGTIEADQDASVAEGDSEMFDVPAHSPQRPNKRQSQEDGDEMDVANDFGTLSPFASSILQIDENDQPKLNWPYIYKQRHKLEQNWLHGRYSNFQLPHPNFPHEAHTECVYTIQFYGKWLVSGSRDKTVRVWDLDTRRLRGKPLMGHSQSVLCLQFDPTPEEDIIVSGSSDSSIVIWKFSTGQKLHTINSAHEESVLNLRFDHRYLVTCSKDKKIKVWNRKELLPTDPDYPRIKDNANCKIPSHIIDLTDVDIPTIETKLANGTYRALKAFSHLMTFEGHHAAVNAIQIHGDYIVSASGDRTIRVWELAHGQNGKVITGHQKGIACVQFDGRRIVSGSSDNTVRIYDPMTGTEVAVLLGHTNLVRTVQAGFGDTVGCEDDERAAAKEAEMRYHQDVMTKKIVDDRHYNRRLRNGEFGSSRVALGSNLPPGGGGSKWARIVSGSYDESIIIWKKDSHGHWVVGQTLKQDENTQSNIEMDASAHGAPRQRPNRRRDDTRRAVQQPPPGPSIQRPTQATVHNTATIGSGNVLSASQIVQATMNSPMASLQSSVQNIVGLSRSLGAAAGSNSNGTLSRPAIQNAMNQITAHAQAVTQNAINQALINGHATVNANITAGASSASATHQVHQSQRATHELQHSLAQQQLAAARHQAQNAYPAREPVNSNQAQNQSVSRVFKLQFDSRRIVCCSQDSRIIGWDFANNDPELEECAKFFSGP